MQTLQQEVITKASKYQNYLTHNGKPPIVRQQFKGDYKQMDYFKEQERRDLEQLTMVLQYVKELNKSALLEL